MPKPKKKATENLLLPAVKQKKTEIGTSTPVNSEDMGAVFEGVGLDKGTVASMLLDLCNWKSIKLDKNGQVTEYIDGALRLKALDLWARLTVKPKATKEEHKHVHISEEQLNDLAAKASKPTGEGEE